MHDKNVHIILAQFTILASLFLSHDKQTLQPCMHSTHSHCIDTYYLIDLAARFTLLLLLLLLSERARFS